MKKLAHGQIAYNVLQVDACEALHELMQTFRTGGLKAEILETIT